MSETPRNGHAPIKMRMVADYSSTPQPGDFRWIEGPDGRRYLSVALPIKSERRPAMFCQFSIDFPNEYGARWSWDGNLEQPTLSPSLHAVGWWHGWVRAGELVEA